MALKSNLTEGPIGITLLKLGVPMFIAMNSFVAFNFIDTEFVGRLGLDPLAAISYTSNVVLVLFSLAFGLGTGVASVVGKAYGSGNLEAVQQITTHGLLLGFILSFVITFLGLPTIDPLFTFFGAPPELLPYLHDFMVMWYWGVPLIIVPMMGNSAIRGSGNTLIPAIIMIIAVGSNIVLDYLLIFGNYGFPRLEIFGASLATFLARVLGLLVGMYFLIFRFNMLTLKGISWKQVLDSWKQILKIGLPAFASHLIIPISIMIVVKIASDMENPKQLVATLQTAGKVDFLAMSIISSLGAVIVPMVAQNFGANKPDRVRQVMKIAYRFCLVWGVAMMLVFLYLHDFWGPLFQEDLIFQKYMSEFFLIVPLGYALRMVFVVSTNALNAYQKAIHAGALTAFEMFVLYVPLCYILPNYLGYQGLFYAFLAANVIAGFFAWRMEKWIFKKII